MQMRNVPDGDIHTYRTRYLVVEPKHRHMEPKHRDMEPKHGDMDTNI